MKRIITFMMALALVLSLSVTAFAAGDGSITITNATVDMNYKLYKIFDATYVEGGTDENGNNIVDTVAYSLKAGSPVYNYMFTGEGVVEDAAAHTLSNGVFTYNTVTGGITAVNNDEVISYLTTMVRALYPDADAAADNDALDACFVANQTATSETVAFTGLEYGYYLIDIYNNEMSDEAKAKAAVTITTNTPSIEVIQKNQLPGGDFDKAISSDGTTWEEDDQNSLSVGDTVYFKLSFTATNYDGDKKVTSYTITDTLDPADWADINMDSIEVKVAGNAITNYSKTEMTGGFELTIPWVDADDNFLYTDVTSAVEVTYNAVVTDAAASNDGAQNNKNEAELDWDKNTGDNPSDETETDVLNLGFTKVDGNDQSKLAGAEFELYSDEACTEPVYITDKGNGVYIVDKDSTNNKVVTLEDGEIVIQGLAAGTYYLKETKAPEGYNMLDAVISVVVGADNADGMKYVGEEPTYTANNANTDVANFSGVELPSTGGVGTMMMISFGTMVAIAFAILMITQKKMSIYRD